MNNRFIIPVFVPHQGCPNDCVFCNQRKITGQNDSYDFEKIDEEIKLAISTIDFSKNPEVEIAFYGGSFTAIAVGDQNNFLEIANKFLKMHKIKGLRLSTRPDYINDKILERLKKYGVKTIELGVQSLNENVLLQSKRGHNKNVVFESSKLIKEHGITLGIQLMIGLPGDNEKNILETVEEVIGIKPDFVRIYPTLVIKETELEELYKMKLYEPLKVEEAVEISKKMYKRFFEETIDVIRIGLQPTKNILEGEDVVAGPFHSAFRELVISKFIIDLIKEKLDDKEYENIKFELNNKDISYLVGNKGVNKQIMKEVLLIKNIKIIPNNEIERGTILMFNDEISTSIKFSN